MDAGHQISRSRGKGGKGHGGSRLGMKTTLSPSPSAPAASPLSVPPPNSFSTLTAPPTSSLSLSLPPPPNSFSVLPAPLASSLSPSLPTSSPAPTPAMPNSSPTDPTSTVPLRPLQGAGVPSRPTQGAGLGAMAPNFSFEQGTQQAPNLRAVYPQGCCTNLLQRPQYPPHPQMQGENFQFVGHTMGLNPISPPPAPPSAYGPVPSQTVKQGTSAKDTVNIDIDEGENREANRAVKKRYWTPEEEERLASAWLNASKDPVKGNDKKFDTFWKEVTDEYNKKGNGKVEGK